MELGWEGRKANENLKLRASFVLWGPAPLPECSPAPPAPEAASRGLQGQLWVCARLTPRELPKSQFLPFPKRYRQKVEKV